MTELRPADGANVRFDPVVDVDVIVEGLHLDEATLANVAHVRHVFIGGVFAEHVDPQLRRSGDKMKKK